MKCFAIRLVVKCFIMSIHFYNDLHVSLRHPLGASFQIDMKCTIK